MTVGSFFRRYYFVFALALSVVLYVVNAIALGQPMGPDKLGVFAPLALAAMASTPAIISGGGGIDLSIAPNMVLANILLVGYLLPSGIPAIASIVIVVLVSAAVGALNGALSVALRLTPIVVTLSMYFILIGVNQKLAPSPLTFSDNPLKPLSGSIGILPGALITILVPFAAWLLISRSTFGRNLLAVGGNDATAFSAGVNISAARIGAFAIGGAMAGLGGTALTSLTSSADASSSSSYTLIAIAAVALGGTSLLGGRGGLLGSLLGASSVFLIQNLLSSLQIPATWLKVTYGGLLLVAIVISSQLSSTRKGPR